MENVASKTKIGRHALAASRRRARARRPQFLESGVRPAYVEHACSTYAAPLLYALAARGGKEASPEKGADREVKD